MAMILMATVGTCEALTALLIKPVFDQVLKPAEEGSRILLFNWPVSGHAVFLQDFFPPGSTMSGRWWPLPSSR
jgi:hypothetical protein